MRRNGFRLTPPLQTLRRHPDTQLMPALLIHRFRLHHTPFEQPGTRPARCRRQRDFRMHPSATAPRQQGLGQGLKPCTGSRRYSDPPYHALDISIHAGRSAQAINFVVHHQPGNRAGADAGQYLMRLINARAPLGICAIDHM